jgi:Pyridoxamine 5'-phosphate oxidase
MVHFYNKIDDNLAEWAMSQTVFFTASAPLHGRHINVSPKGLPSTSFSILDPNLCGYVDATGSGIETVSHIQENGRVTIMFCSFDSMPRIMRLFCTGRVIPWDHPDFDSWRERMGNKSFIGMRAVILLDVWKVTTITPRQAT